MPRKNRRDKSQEYEPLDIARISGGFRRQEFKRGKSWNVQPISVARALKEYTCPGCTVKITVGVAHLAVWEAESMFGDEAGLRDRRHWHTHCWEIY